MQVNDSFTVAAPIEKVWEFLLDIDRMSKCVPGLQSVTKVDDRTYRGAVKVKVGVIGATFTGTATITEMQPPNKLAASLQADDKGIASLVQGVFSSTLVPIEGGTEVQYQMDVNMRGRLAQFGTAAILSTTKKMTADFTQKVRMSLEGTTDEQHSQLA
jgi:carbon monoxide dehydrogenase subunit G